MRAILVSVDYSDILNLTLPYNRHHFSSVMVVTTPSDIDTQRIARRNDCRLFITSAFYDDGADFNKWKALELALNVYGRMGWMVLMDADVVWPKVVLDFSPEVGKLYSPYARVLMDPSKGIPPESDWVKLSRRSNPAEWAGYTQIFSADDPVLGDPPWHQTNWKHAGGADSFFQFKWKPENKIRPEWECLHIGASGRNWCGRVTPYVNGTKPKEADDRTLRLRGYLQQRRMKIRKDRKWHSHTFEHEKIITTETPKTEPLQGYDVVL